MNELSDNHQRLLDQAVKAAQDAGACIIDYYGKEYEIFSKGIGTHTGDVVTQADRDAQQIIFDTLLKPFEHTPLLDDIAVLAEEMPDYSASQRFTKPYCFLVDPLDGTRGFVDRTNSFAVSIGLIQRDGTPVFGVADLPALNKRFVGIHKQKTWLNEEQIQRDDPCEGTLVLWISEAEVFPEEKNRVWHSIGRHIRETTAIAKIRPACLGSPVHKGCNLISSPGPGLYLGLPRKQRGVSLWDLAAIASIVTGAGGWVSDIDGNPLELNRQGSIYAHHKGFLMATHEEIAVRVLECWQSQFQGLEF